MKLAIVAAAAALITHSMALAQNASTGSTTTSGDASVSPAMSNAGNTRSSSDNPPSPGAGVASGVLNNGTTGDTIGTGHGTPPAPTTATGAASAPPKPN